MGEAEATPVKYRLANELRVSVLVKDGLLVTQDGSRSVFQGSVSVDGPVISGVGPEVEAADTVIDARGCIVLPGLLNCYTTSAHVLLGPPRDQPLETVRERMETLRENMTRRDVQMASALACAEMLLSGTTSFLDVFPWQEEVARAVTEVGIRGSLGRMMISTRDFESARAYIRRVRSWDRVTPMVSAPGLRDSEIVEEAASISKEEGVRWILPVAETRGDVYRFQRKEGHRPVEWLEKKGFLSPQLIAPYAVWLTLNEVRALARQDVKAVHCPVSNQLSGVGGPSPLVEMAEAGVKVGLGSDSPALCGSLDLFEHMRACAALHKGHRWDPEVMSAQVVLDMATIQAAEVLGLNGGSLVPGKLADLVVLDPGKRGSRVLEQGDIISYLVYIAGRSQVRDVMVDGKLVVEDGVIRTVDLDPLWQEMSEMRKELLHEDPRD